MLRARTMLVSAVLVGAGLIPAGAGANPPGFSLSISGPAEYEIGQPVVLSGILSVLDAAGLPLQDVALKIDGVTAAVAQTDLSGAWSVTHTFSADPPASHTLQAVAFEGLPLETQSSTLQITRRVALSSISVTPHDPLVIIGQSLQFTAMGTYSDGSVADVTTEVTWSSSNPSVATISSTGLASTFGIGVTTIGASLDSIAGTTTLTVSALDGLVINEVDYDQPGTDTAEFVEIFNTTSSSIGLDGVALVLVNGATNLEYARVSLSGVLGPGGYAVVASPAVSVPGGTLVFPVPSGGVQNGAPDGVALLDTLTPRVIDALSYEGSIHAAQIEGFGTYDLVEGTAATAVDSGTVAGSLSRLPDGRDTNDADSDWAFATTPTPGAPNVP